MLTKRVRTTRRKAAYISELTWSPRRLAELVGEQPGQRAGRREKRPCQPRTVADQHGDGHGFSHRSSQRENGRGDDAGCGCGKDDAEDGLPPRRAERVGAFPQCSGHGDQRAAGNCGDRGKNHERQHEARREHAVAVSGRREDGVQHGNILKGNDGPRSKALNERNDNEDSPKPVNDAGNGRQHLHGKAHNLADGEREKILAEENCNRQPQGQRKNERYHRAHHGADQKGRNPVDVSIGHPLRVGQKIEAEFLDRRGGLPGDLENNPRENGDSRGRRHPAKRPKKIRPLLEFLDSALVDRCRVGLHMAEG